MEEQKEKFLIEEKEGEQPEKVGKAKGCFARLCGGKENIPRSIYLNGKTEPERFPNNVINNQKYNLFTFLPLVLYNQFKQFYNLFFLVICLSQLFPAIRIGFLVTYVAPLVFVLSITLLKEAYDDFKRYRRDRETNSEKYKKLLPDGNFSEIESCNIKVGDILLLEEKRRIPADMVLLYTSESSGAVFIKTDQLDGETDWKLRKAIPRTQEAGNISFASIYNLQSYLRAEPPHRDIYKFQGTFYYRDCEEMPSDYNAYGLELESTLWASTVLTMGQSLGLVTYTGSDTKSQLNMRDPRTKSGKIDQEIIILFELLNLLLKQRRKNILIFSLLLFICFLK